MKYVYKNLKHVTIQGIPPFSTMEFDHKLEGGGIELIETIKDEKPINKKTKESDK